MCVIIIKNNNNKIPNKTLQKSSVVNPHGLGIVWLDTYKIEYTDSKNYSRLDTNRPFIAHFRYATVGKVGLSNTHPFRCGKSHEYLMMNGTIRTLGNDRECDTKVLANKISKKDRNEWKNVLSQYSCRFVSVNTKRKQYQIYNKDLFTKVDGVWYSKTNVLPSVYVGVYGTLKCGHGNHRLLMSSTFIGKGKTNDRYPLTISSLPYLHKQENVGHNVEVEVYKVDHPTLEQLDRLEGHPHFYKREVIEIRMNSGRLLSAWVYFVQNRSHNNERLHKRYGGYEDTYNISTVSDHRKWCEYLQDDIYCPNCDGVLTYNNNGVYHCDGCMDTIADTYYEEDIRGFNNPLF